MHLQHILCGFGDMYNESFSLIENHKDCSTDSVSSIISICHVDAKKEIKVVINHMTRKCISRLHK